MANNKTLSQRVAELEARIPPRERVAEAIADLLASEFGASASIDHSYVGPLNGMSSRVTTVVLDHRDEGHRIAVNVYDLGRLVEFDD